jgi:hypothetical protein
MRWAIFVALVVACGKNVAVGEATGDAGADAGSCPDYVPNDTGVVALMRGCPLTIDYTIR